MNRLGIIKGQVASILGGISETWNQSGEGQFLASLGIDPEAATGALIKSSGGIIPSPYSEFSSASVGAAPMWITGVSTSSGVWSYLADGSLVTYSAVLASEEVKGIPTSGAGNGMAYYNDYVYLSTPTNISRQGRLSLTAPTMTNGYWVTDLGMSALTNSTFPSTRDVTYPNHVLWPHSDGRLYVADYDGANGRIHSLTTDSDGTNGSGSYNDLTLPPGYMPMDMKTYGGDLAIALSPQAKYAAGAIPKAAGSLLALWDAVPGNRPYRFVPINEPLATAVIVKNGELFVLAGQIDADVKLLRYLGGYSFETLAVVSEGFPPPAGAADVLGNMLVWGGSTTYPATSAGLFAYGFRSGKLPGNSLNHIGRISDTSGTNPIVTCVKFLQRGRFPVIGWRTGSTFGLDKKDGSGTQSSYFRSPVQNIGKKFILRRLTVPLSAAVSAGVTITPTVYVDDESSNFTPGGSSANGLNVINSTNYASSERLIDFQGLTIHGNHNFYVEFQFTGTTLVGIIPPISYEVEVTD